MPSFVSGIAVIGFAIIFISFFFVFRHCRHILSTLTICRILPAAKHRQNAKAPLPAKTAGLQNKERNEHDGESVLCIEEIFLSSSLVYSIPDFQKTANFCRIFSRSADDGNRHSMQHPAAGTIFVSWPSESGIPPATFRTISSLYRYRRAKPPARHCTSFRLDRPALSRPPYLLYRANLRLPFANNLSSQAPSAPATTFQEPQTNKQKNLQKQLQKYPQQNLKITSKKNLQKSRLPPVRENHSFSPQKQNKKKKAIKRESKKKYEKKPEKRSPAQR